MVLRRQREPLGVQELATPSLTRQDGAEFLALAHAITIEAETTVFPLEQADQALHALRTGALQGAAVLRIRRPGGGSRTRQGQDSKGENTRISGRVCQLGFSQFNSIFFQVAIHRVAFNLPLPTQACRL